MAGRAETPKPPLLETPKPPLPEGRAAPAATIAIPLNLHDKLTVLALVISIVLAYGAGDAVILLAKKVWDEEGVIVFCAKSAVFTVTYGCAFAGVIFLWQKAASYKEEEYKDKLRYIIPSILVVCTGYVALEYLQGDVAGVTASLLVLGKSLAAAMAFVFLAAGCYLRAVVYKPWDPRNAFEMENLKTMAAIVLLCCYSACVASYAKQGWKAEEGFWSYWGNVLVLTELPLTSIAACNVFKDMVVDYEQSVMDKPNDMLVTGVVAAAVASGLMYLAACGSASAHESDGTCSFTCGVKVEAAITLASFSCLVVYHMLNVINKMQRFEKLAKAIGVLVLGFVALHGHGYTLPKWIGSVLPTW